MKKHSPNFFDNLQEADTAKNNRATTFFWTVVLAAVFMLGLSVTKTKAQTSKLLKVADTAAPHIPLITSFVSHHNNFSMRYDTTPVVMLVTDTSIEMQKDFFLLSENSSYKVRSFVDPYPVIMIGYQVNEFTKSGDGINSIIIQSTETTYLNHLKQPLPERLIVWMAVRRKTL